MDVAQVDAVEQHAPAPRFSRSSAAPVQGPHRAGADFGRHGAAVGATRRRGTGMSAVASTTRRVIYLSGTRADFGLRTYSLNLVVNDIRNRVAGNITSQGADPAIKAAAEHYRSLRATSHAALGVVTISLAIAAMLYVRSRISPVLRARNQVEGILTILLIACSSTARFPTRR